MLRRPVWLLALALAVPAHAQTSANDASLRAEAAQHIAARLIPDGIYEKMMSGTFDKMLDGMMNQMMDLPLRDFLKMGGLDNAKLTKMSPASLREISAIIDPAMAERSHVMMKVMMPEMGKIMSRMEPSVRSGVATAYANRFSAAQLAELDRFFATPTGSEYAAQSMLIMTDPAVLEQMQAMMPELMKAMPAILEKVKAANDSLPKPKKATDLTPAERKRLGELLGVDLDKAK